MAAASEAGAPRNANDAQQRMKRNVRPRPACDGFAAIKSKTIVTFRIEGIARLFAVPEVTYLHAHYATRGCYAARIERA